MENGIDSGRGMAFWAQETDDMQNTLKRGEMAEVYVCERLGLQSHGKWTDRYDASDANGNLYEVKSCKMYLTTSNGRRKRGSFVLRGKDLYNDKSVRLVFVIEHADGHMEYIGQMKLGEYRRVFGAAGSVSWRRIYDYVGLTDAASTIVDVGAKQKRTKQSNLDEYLSEEG